MSSLDYLINRLRNVKVLSRQELYALIYQYKAGDESAGKKIILHHTKYVIKLATHFVQKHNVEYDDVITYGIIGLYKAMNKFNPELGLAFSTYAWHWIMQSIARRCLWNRDIVNTKHKGVTRFIFKSFDDPDRWEGYDTCNSTTDKHESVFVNIHIEKYLDDLPDRTRSLMRYKFGFEPDSENMTLRQIGKLHGICHERVRQIINEQIKKMRRNKKLRSLVGKE